MSRKNLIFFLISLGFIFSIQTLSNKIALEKTLRTIEIACDFNDVRYLADISGKSQIEVLQDLKKVGITTLGLTEPTVKELADRGIVILADGSEIEKWQYVFKRRPRFLESRQIVNKAGYIYLFTENPSQGKLIKDSLAEKLPGSKVIGTYTGKYYLVIAESAKFSVSNIHLGFWEEEISTLKSEGFNYILRPASDPFVTEKWLARILTPFSGDPALTGLLPYGTKLPGNPDEFAAIIKQLDIPLGTIEFAKIDGAKPVIDQLKKTFLCFSPKGRNDSGKINACLRSVKERNVQLLYIHPGDESYPEFLAFSGSIKRRLEEAGLKVAKFAALPLWSGNAYSYIFIGLAVFAAVYWLLSIIFTINRQFEIAYVVISLMGTIFFSGYTSFRLLIAFLATVTFPVLAISKTWKKPSGPAMSAAIWLFLKVTLLSSIGAIFVAAILSSTDFMLKINSFRGVKLSLLSPILIAFLVLYGREKSYFSTSLNRLWHKRLEIRHLIAGIALTTGLVLMILRSSNHLSFLLPFEMEIRNLLEKIFFARPRFKEFLFGHPMMILGFYFYMLSSQPKKIQFRPFIILGLVGQVSLINTFAHIHSPLAICLFRTLNGIGLGIIAGICLISANKLLKLISPK